MTTHVANTLLVGFGDVQPTRNKEDDRLSTTSNLDLINVDRPFKLRLKVRRRLSNFLIPADCLEQPISFTGSHWSVGKSRDCQAHGRK